MLELETQVLRVDRDGACQVLDLVTTARNALDERRRFDAGRGGLWHVVTSFCACRLRSKSIHAVSSKGHAMPLAKRRARFMAAPPSPRAGRTAAARRRAWCAASAGSGGAG